MNQDVGEFPLNLAVLELQVPMHMQWKERLSFHGEKLTLYAYYSLLKCHPVKLNFFGLKTLNEAMLRCFRQMLLCLDQIGQTDQLP